MSDFVTRLGAKLVPRLSLPVIAAPMLRVSGVGLVIAACRAGVIGAFPTSNCSTLDELDDWLYAIFDALAPTVPGMSTHAPACANLIIRQKRLDGDLDRLLQHRIEMVITSVGSPVGVVGPLHEIGCKVFADVASIVHAEKAIAAGVDGLILLTAGAGGQTGWANPFAFVGAVRSFYDGPIVLAGGVADGRALWAAQALGCDLVYMGTRFIAANESMASDRYRQMLVKSNLDDVLTTRAFTGLPANMLIPSIAAAGLGAYALDETISLDGARAAYGADRQTRRWSDIWSAGHSVSAVTGILSAAEIVEKTKAEYRAARAASTSAGHFSHEA